MERENLKSYLIGISYSVASELAGNRHLAILMCKPRSGQEATWSMARIWL